MKLQTAERRSPMTTSMQPLSKTVRVNDLGLHYLEWGEADASPIVCVHGYTGSADAFNALARHLKDRYRILALDVRGHGESAWSPTGAIATPIRRATWRHSPDSWGLKSSSRSGPRWAASSRWPM